MEATTLPEVEKLAHPKMLVRMCLLLILAENKAHGYDMVGRLKAFGITTKAPGSVYHLLRKLESDGLVCSAWDLPDGNGPARRVYELTPAGQEHLAESTDDVLACHLVLETFLARQAGPGGCDGSR